MKIEVILTGTKYYRGFPCLDLGGEVRIEADEENEYSNNAFSVSTLGGLRIGSVAENPRYIPRKMTSDITKLSPELKELLNDGYTIDKAICKKINNNMAIIEVKLNDKPIIIPMEEDNMNNAVITVVGTRYHPTTVTVGDIVSFRVVKGTTTAFDINGNSLGVLPQSERKVKELENIGAPIVLNQFAKTDFHTLESVWVVSKIEEDKYIFLREFGEEDCTSALLSTEKEVVDHIGQFTVLEDLLADELMIKATIEVVKNIVKEDTTDEVVEEPIAEVEEIIEEEEENMNIEDELKELNHLIRALKAQKEAIESEMAQLMEKREKLAEINAKRIALIKEISDEIKTFSLEDLQQMKGLMPSSYKEEDISSSNEEDTTSSSFDEAVEEINSINNLEELYNRCINLNSYLGKICSDIENMNLETRINTGYVHKRNMEGLTDDEISELNLKIYRREKILKGIIKE